MDIKVKINADDVKKNLRNNIDRYIEEIIYPVFNRNRAQAIEFAKDKAPWTDRTGNARGSIDAEDISTRKELRYTLFIGVYYGVFLELAHQGKYRIIGPTVDRMGHRLMDDLDKVGKL